MKIRVCFIAQKAGDWGGASRSLSVLLKLLDKSKVDPYVIFSRHGPKLDELADLGVGFTIWGNERELNNPLSYIKEVARLIYFLRKRKIDLIHMNYANYWRPAEFVAARILRIPIITHYRTIQTQLGPFVRYSKLIIANSAYTAANSASDSVPIEVVHNMVEVERYDRAVSIRHEIGLGDENLLITFIGQISEIKGIDLFLELAKKIESKNVRFLIAGSCKDPKKFKGGYSHEKLLGLIRSDPRIHYLGRRSDVENVYKSSDIIVMPSRWDEPFGLVNIEAGAAGKPIVATKVGGISEIIENGDNGFLVERDDIAAMTNIVCNLMNSRDLRERIGIRARAVVEEKFTRAPARKLESIYQNMSVKN